MEQADKIQEAVDRIDTIISGTRLSVKKKDEILEQLDLILHQSAQFENIIENAEDVEDDDTPLNSETPYSLLKRTVENAHDATLLCEKFLKMMEREKSQNVRDIKYVRERMSKILLKVSEIEAYIPKHFKRK